MINSKMCEYNLYLAVCHIMPVSFTGPGPSMGLVDRRLLICAPRKKGQISRKFHPGTLWS
jgi:hypothetical protein|uniref:Uncharacterized protein n=1 Tax=Leptospirillum ferriphilum TaxID=178606 RepID=A0A2I2MI72_9BACT